ncbi:uncharacterized protein LOC132737011 [Ruditapes philippinarum]|uniref:uncharacterized protein LOC132737011 n=1 Tax=Ruditapes philippinarum TaxID=129788 RepID=UPI00295B7D0D|nr:uncharacterized protein LOC132737011 [Ruditapes philippinarum]
MIVQTGKPAGAQTDLWNEVIDSFNTFSVLSPADVSHTLINALTKKQHYNLLAKGVEWMICTHKKLVCGCQLRYKYIPERLFSSIISSFSPQSSETDIFIGLNDDASSSIHSTESDNPQNEIKKDGQVPLDCYQGDKIIDENIVHVSTCTTNNSGQEVSSDAGKSCSGDKGQSPPDISIPTRGQSRLTQSFSGPIATTTETTSAHCQPRRPSVTRQHAILTDDWEISCV